MVDPEVTEGSKSGPQQQQCYAVLSPPGSLLCLARAKLSRLTESVHELADMYRAGPPPPTAGDGRGQEQGQGQGLGQDLKV